MDIKAKGQWDAGQIAKWMQWLLKSSKGWCPQTQDELLDNTTAQQAEPVVRQALTDHKLHPYVIRFWIDDLYKREATRETLRLEYPNWFGGH